MPRCELAPIFYKKRFFRGSLPEICDHAPIGRDLPLREITANLHPLPRRPSVHPSGLSQRSGAARTEIVQRTRRRIPAPIQNLLRAGMRGTHARAGKRDRWRQKKERGAADFAAPLSVPHVRPISIWHLFLEPSFFVTSFRNRWCSLCSGPPYLFVFAEPN